MKKDSIYGMLFQYQTLPEGLTTMLKKKTSRKVKEVRTSRAAEAIKVLNASIEDSIAEELRSADKKARRKKAVPAKRETRP
jgi:hypothetical protein